MQQLSLMSSPFLGLAIATALLMAGLSGFLRQAVFLAANILFVWGLLLGFKGAVSTIAFCLLGYLLTLLILRQRQWGFVTSVVAFVLLFIYMRNYDFLHWVLPNGVLAQTLATVGLSFLFFKIVHVMIEARSGTLGSLEFPTYLNYCMNFTTFMMGPIQRYPDFYRQLHRQEEAIPLKFEAHIDAVLRILVGFLKAYVIADFLSQYALAANQDLIHQSVGVLILRIYAFYFFLYFNFAGYCDIVIGVGSLIGIRPPENFDKPFLARNISEFWLRFHQTLTSWLTNYVFSPVYKWTLTNRWFATHPLLSVNAALLLTMVISGLWHGTTLNFLLFGLTHGFYFIAFRTWDSVITRRFGKQLVREWRARWFVQLLGIVITFNAVAFSLVFFRLDAGQALRLLARLIGL
jgi:D-alanyl-lipoteichoic acid acyltransferase DltB (MBOAT superfamily)